MIVPNVLLTGLKHSDLHVRRLKELKPVLYDRRYCRIPYLEVPVYEIHRNCCNDEARQHLLSHGLRYDVTIMPPLLLGEEYVKTFGHCHLPHGEEGSPPEIFEVLEGEALFLAQKERFGKIEQVFLWTVKEGERILMPPEYGHVMINASSKQLVVGNLISQNCVQMYDPYTRRRGAAFYVLTEMRLVKNPRYPEALEIQTSKVDTHPILESQLDLVETFMTNPDQLRFMNAETPQVAGRGLALSALSLERPEPFESLGELGAQTPNVTIVIPTMNEARCVEEVLRGTGKYLGKPGTIVVVDASSDETPDIAARLGVKVLKQQGQGKGSAMREAFHATNSEIVVIMDGDGSMRAEEIPQFIRVASSGADIVKGSRFLPGGGSEDLSLIRRIGNALFLSLVNFLWSTKYTDLCYGYIAFRKDALGRLKPYLNSDGFQIETEICIKAKKLGLRVLEVPSFELRRRHGKSKIHAMSDSFRILRTILAEWLSDFSHPL